MVSQPIPPLTSTLSSALHSMSYEAPLPLVTTNFGLYSPTGTTMEQAMMNRLVEMETMIQRISGIPTPPKKSQPNNSPFVGVIALIEMPKNFSSMMALLIPRIT